MQLKAYNSIKHGSYNGNDYQRSKDLPLFNGSH